MGITLDHTGDSEAAAELFDRVIESEKNGINALIYKNSIGGHEVVTAEQAIARSESGKPKPEKKKKVKTRKKPARGTFPRFIAGFLTGAALMGIACYPFLSDKLGIDDTTDKNSFSAKEYADLQQSFTALQSEYASLEEAKNKAESEKSG